jgi:sugar phosphate isomerase/epimerase
MLEERGDWTALVSRAVLASSVAVELAALSEHELPSLLDYLSSGPSLPFFYVSVHGPSKDRELPEPELAARLASLPGWVDAIVMHPETIEDPAAYRPLGRRLVLENMDERKGGGRTLDELMPVFESLPEAGFCFDVAHAKSVDPSLAEGGRMLDALGARLRHLHVSSLDAAGHHVPLDADDEELFRPLLRRCRDVPWILEAAPRAC